MPSVPLSHLLANGLPQPDWTAPWYRPVADVGQAAWRALEAGRPVHHALETAAAAARRPDPAGWVPPAFVPAHEQPPGTAYESFVFTNRSVPTRDTLHDFFNGLVWCAYPRTKRHLNELQAAAIARDGVGSRRGPLRDAITLLDENGAVFSAPPELVSALQARDWHQLFVARRADWRHARMWLFGHALLEKLVAPRKDITAHVLCAPPGLDTIGQVDAWMQSTLPAAHLANKPFSPMPVLGVPGWWPANSQADYYRDPAVFRARRDTVGPRT